MGPKSMHTILTKKAGHCRLELRLRLLLAIADLRVFIGLKPTVILGNVIILDN